MPTALATTKRKFHKLLDSISNASTPSLVPQNEKANASTSTLPANFAPPSKRLRVERPRPAYIPPFTSSAASETRPVSLVPRAARPTAGEAKVERKAPNYAPWDRQQFLDRLKTFRHVDKWLGKPDPINEVEWAKRGWSCVGKETVRCVGGCEVVIVVKLEDERGEGGDNRDEEEGDDSEGRNEDEEEEQAWRDAAQKELVERYADMIESAHGGGCLWRRRGCDDTIHRLPLIHPATAIRSLRERYDAITAMSDALPSPSVFSTPPGLDTSKLTSHAKPLLFPATPSSNAPSASSIDVNTPALLLSLFGWSPEESGHLPGLVTCTACFRRLGLWLFKSPPTSAGANWSEESALSRLDVVGEHREYCPWVNALSQNGGSRRTSLDQMSGWEVLVRAVRNTARRKEEEREDGDGGGARDGEVDGAGHGVNDKSEVVSLTAEEEKARDEDRKSRLKRLKQVFTVKKKENRKSLGV